MDPPTQQLHVVFFPFMAQGHMIPLVDMARLFARRGAKSTIITTPLNAPLFSHKVRRDFDLGLPIHTHIIQFPSAEANLPQGCENINSIDSPEMLFPFFTSMDLFQRPVEELLRHLQPDCFVADFLFHWATDTARTLAIPRLFFNGTGAIAMCIFDSLKRHKPYEGVESDFDPFLIPNLPYPLQFVKLQLSPQWTDEVKYASLMEWGDRIVESMVNCFGSVLNSFHELEGGFSEHFREKMGRKAWFVGPLSIANGDGDVEKAERGNSAAAIDEDECLRWLDCREPNSVIYVCFGSISSLPDAQLIEIAAALERSGRSFIWVVKKGDNKDLGEFEKSMEGKGLIIRGWAPQVLILDHQAIGGFVTHCGWNSLLEGVAAGVPMVTWPLQAEQFFNEKLLTDVLKVGVGVGSQEWSDSDRKIIVEREDIERAISQVMVDEEIRKRAEELREVAVRANEEGGSSYRDLTSLLDELASLRKSKDEGDSSILRM